MKFAISGVSLSFHRIYGIVSLKEQIEDKWCYQDGPLILELANKTFPVLQKFPRGIVYFEYNLFYLYSVKLPLLAVFCGLWMIVIVRQARNTWDNVHPCHTIIFLTLKCQVAPDMWGDYLSMWNFKFLRSLFPPNLLSQD